MERRKFTREFKLEAVRLIKERGVSYGYHPLRTAGMTDCVCAPRAAPADIPSRQA